ncbi:MAG: LysM peptidoglycan-binding domain-containing protein [Verrucomicrobia bacterium]|nr:LysM peptidoglycan-binding domain-containing protein [Verrucomicrobiota bacterium]
MLKREVADLSRGQRPAENKTTPTISASGKPEKTISSNPVATPPENKGNIPKTYVVQKNDNLSIISRKIYGTSNRATDIFKANKDKMASPATLQVGMTLVIPE